MNESNISIDGAVPEKRGVSAALLGLVLQGTLCAFLAGVSVWNDSAAVQAVARLAGGGIGIWFMLWLLAYQRKLVAEERIEAEELLRERERGGKGTAIFEVDQEQLLLAQRRLHVMLRWLVPAWSLVLAAYYVCAGLLWWALPLTASLDADAWPEVGHLSVSSAYLFGAAFVAFLYSRYASGMARVARWRELRAGSSSLFGVALAAALVALTLGFAHFQVPVLERIAAQFVRVLMLALGSELLLNLLLDIYRPRVSEVVARPSFDSRLLGLFSESGGIAKSIADAVNYQFGFEVSRTWFYQLMQRSIVPLLAFGGLCLMVSSAVVVVEPHEEAIVERLGRPLQVGEALGPGLHWKLPWPVDRAYRYPVRRVQQIVLGAATEEEDKRPEPEMVLWTTAGHGESKDNYVLVAIPPERTRAAGRIEEEDEDPREGRGVPVTILRALAPVQYRIKDVFAWAYGYANPQELLEGLATRELIQLAASLDADGILGAQRAEAAAELQKRIQTRCDEIGLGVEITFVGFQDFHPDKDVAGAYQNVVGAEQERESLIEEARAQMNTVLAGVAGDVRLALALAEAVRHAAELARSEPVDESALREATSRRDALFERAAGDVSARIARARGERWRRENEWLGNAERFASEVAANRAAPRVYQYWRYLEALRGGLDKVRKVLVAVDTSNRELVVIFDQKQEETFRGLK